MSENVGLELLSRMIDQVLDQRRRLEQQQLQVLESLSRLQETAEIAVGKDAGRSDVRQRP